MDNDGVCLYCGNDSQQLFCCDRCEIEYARYWASRKKMKNDAILAAIIMAIVPFVLINVLFPKWAMIVGGISIILISYVVNTTLLVEDAEMKKVPIITMKEKVHKLSICVALVGVAMIIANVVLLATIW